MSIYMYPLAVQISVPENYSSDAAAKEMFSLISEKKLHGVEVNFADPEKLDFKEFYSFLDDYDLKMTYFASGLTAKSFGLSLSSEDEKIRVRSVETVKRIIDKMGAAGTDRGIIIGFFKGGPRGDSVPRRELFRKSIMELAPPAEQASVPLCVEATNRYESCVANSLDDTVQLLDGLFNGALEILPDTFHMNIEESDQAAALKRNRDKFHSVHLSDNNRFLPGFGAIDFKKLFRTLKETGFSGGIALEGNINTDFRTDFSKATEYLEKISAEVV